MNEWIMRAEIEADVSLPAEADTRLHVECDAPPLDVYLQNGGSGDRDAPFLIAHLRYPAPDFEQAHDLGKQHLARLANRLAFAAGARSAVRSVRGLFEWRGGPGERKGKIYATFPNPALPVAVLTPHLVPTLAKLLSTDLPTRVERALHWFAAGTSAEHQDEQFQFFWFAIELAAMESRDTTPVADECPRCRSSLYCRECEEVPTHKPFAKQAISQLFYRHISDEPQRAFEIALAMRNAMLHGGRVREVEQRFGTTIQLVADGAGRLASAALTQLLGKQFEETDSPVRLLVLRPDTFVRHEALVEADMSFGDDETAEARIEDLPTTKINLVPHDSEPGETDKDE